MPEVIFTGPQAASKALSSAKQQNAPIAMGASASAVSRTMNHHIIPVLLACAPRVFGACALIFRGDRPQPGSLITHRRTLRCRVPRSLAQTINPEARACWVARLLVRRMDRHAAVDAPARGRRF